MDHKERNLDIFALLIRYHDLRNEVLRVWRNGLLANGFNKLTKLHRQALLALERVAK